jgi:hypothetical protein
MNRAQMRSKIFLSNYNNNPSSENTYQPTTEAESRQVKEHLLNM